MTPGQESGHHVGVSATAEVRSVPSGRNASLAAWSLGGVLAVGVVMALVLPAIGSGYATGWPWWIHAPVAGMAFGAPAVLLLRTDAGSRMGWLLGLVALLFVIPDVAAAWAWLSLVGEPGSLPGGELALWLAWALWLPAWILLPTVLLLVAPDGHVPGRRWRPVLWYAVAVVVAATVANALSAYPQGADADLTIPDQPARLANPVEVDAAEQVAVATGVLLAIAVGACLAGLVVRRRQAVGLQRRQLDVVVIGAVATVALGVVSFFIPRPYFLVTAVAALTPYPVALGIAAARHQLYELDLVVRRSVVYGIVTACMVAAYLVAIVGLGGVLGDTTGAPLLATAVVAVGAAPLYHRVQKAVDRRIYGDRGDPSAVARRVIRRWQESSGRQGAETLDGLAHDITANLRLSHARIITATGAEGSAGQLVAPELRLPLRHGATVVGELVVGAREPGHPLTRRDTTALAALAEYVAVVVHALSMSEDLARSRERVVLAREEERRRLRRDLHDQLGPELAAIALQLETVRDLADGPDTPAGALAERLRGQVREVVSGVRGIVEGLRPPILDDLGLTAALRQQADALATPSLPIDVHVEELPPLSAAVDLAALRIVGEALTNVTRHSGARSCRVEVRTQDGLLELVVSDDGVGADITEGGSGLGLTSMRERAVEVGGSCMVESGERGTRVRALLPIGPTTEGET